MLAGFGIAALLLPLGFALGWYLHQLAGQRPEAQPGSGIPRDYLVGLQFLAGGDTDQALLALTRSSVVDRDSLELQLTLGRLFRKRGEIDRALKIHQQLIERDDLPTEQHNSLRLELARDYHEAGLLDRAEEVYEGLLGDGMFRDEALRALQSIFEQTHDWARAEATALELQGVIGQSQAAVVAHYRCEQAEALRAEGDVAAAIAMAEKALTADRDCVRASLLLGALHESEGQFKRAARALERVPDQSPRFFSIVLPMLRRIYAEAGDLKGYRRYLREAENHYDSPQPRLARLRLVREEGEDVSADLLALCHDQPTWSGLRLLAEWHAEQSPVVAALHHGIELLAQKAPRYRCHHCGLAPSLQFWQCPSCKMWGSVEPEPDRLDTAA